MLKCSNAHRLIDSQAHLLICSPAYLLIGLLAHLHLRKSVATITVVLQVVPVGSSGFNFTHDRNSQKQKALLGLILPGRVRYKKSREASNACPPCFLAGTFEEKDDGGFLRSEQEKGSVISAIICAGVSVFIG
jgi:hypothetical protein